MGLIFLVMLGAVLGWIAAIILRVRRHGELEINITTGVGGALIAGLIINPLIGEGNMLHGGYSVEALLVSVGGSLVMLVSVNLLRCSELR